ncbi:sugar phosphate isomerase/epimerase family protein [Methanobacterium alcaliphilum]|uniref:sugar phosphate isomerase/epimerase family protein n=1 Tax=Methanobacterium alcaliphilum TaxID=392018 RepID=UPI00200A7632|nr:sugar phosphate isomerase/epimerase [Methanobacterium alcaliphilum]MCK9151744.1 sugar phosphate isomerase/epimerase [Methanobacterium alcaliphilum]
MKIGVSTLALYPAPLEEILSFLEEYKVDYCELINEYPMKIADSDILDSYNVSFTIHSPISDINLASPNESIRKSSIAQVKESMDLAMEINANVVVVHPGQVPFLARIFMDKILKNNFSSMQECSRYSDDLGIKMCIENMPDMEGYLFKDLDELHHLVDELNVYMTLDAGHANTMGIEAEDMVKSNHLQHIHLSDNDGSFDHHEALGQGNIDFEELLKHLNKKNYNEILTIEVKNKAEVLESLNFLNKII